MKALILRFVNWVISVLKHKNPEPVLPSEIPAVYWSACWNPPLPNLKNLFHMPKFGDQGDWDWAVRPALNLFGLITFLRQMPKGRRVIQSWDMYQAWDTYQGVYGPIGLFHHPEDSCRDQNGNFVEYALLKQDGLPDLDASGKQKMGRFPGPWNEKAITLVAAKHRKVFQTIKDAGLEIDGLFVDNEDGISMWDSRFWLPGKPWQKALMGDPRWPELGKRLERYGMKNLDQITEFRTSDDAGYFNSAMLNYKVEAMNAAIYQTLKEFFPTAETYNDSTYIRTKANAMFEINGLLDSNDHGGYGTHDCREYYGGFYTEGLANKIVDGAPFGKSVWKAFLLDINQARSDIRSSSRPRIPVLSPKNWNPGQAGSTFFLGTPYWDERVKHLAMEGCTRTVNWNIEVPGFPRDSEDAILDVVLEDCKVNAPDQGVPIFLENLPWDTSYVVSGLQCKNYKIFRVTLRDPEKPISIILPGARTMTTLQPKVGECGVWVKIPS